MTLEKTHRLILKNDDENDYMFVIACLMRFCNHDKEQAEQCAIIAHNNDKCDIKSGNFVAISGLWLEMHEVGLNVELEEYESSLYK